MKLEKKINCEIPIKVNSFQQSAVSSVYIFWIKKNVCMFQRKIELLFINKSIL